MFEDYALAWQKVQVHRSSTAEAVDSHLRNWLIPFFEGRPIGDLRKSDARQLVKHLDAQLAPNTVKLVFSWFRSICLAAVEDGLLETNPCVRVKLPSKDPGQAKVTPLHPWEVEALHLAAPVELRCYIHVLAATGMRPSEGLGLTVEQIDWSRRQLRVDRQLVTVTGQPPTLGRLKTDASYRTVPLARQILAELEAHLSRFGEGEQGIVFLNKRGLPWRRNRMYDEWRSIRYRAAVRPDASPHDLRHFYASALIAAGADVVTVQARLGHANASETLDTYSHLWYDREDHTREAMEGLLDEMRDSRGTEDPVRFPWSEGSSGVRTRRVGDSRGTRPGD